MTDPRTPVAGGGRRWWWLVAVAAAVVAAPVAVVAARDGPGPPADGCVAGPAGRTGVAGPAVAPAVGGLRVVEQGFRQVGESGRSVSLGVVVENTSGLVAYRTRISFHPFGGHRRPVVAEGSGEFLDQEIPVILPGQRIGAAAATQLREEPVGRPVVVGGFDVQLGTPQWWPPANDVYPFAAVGSRHRRSVRSNVEPSSGTVAYAVESAYCGVLIPRGVATLFRDPAGVLVGGGFSLDRSRDRCRPGSYEQTSTLSMSIPPDIDDSRTESYPYCDPGVPRPSVQEPSAPVN